MSDFMKIQVLAYSPIDEQFKPLRVRSWQQIIDALKQWTSYRQPIVIAYRVHRLKMEALPDDWIE